MNSFLVQAASVEAMESAYGWLSVFARLTLVVFCATVVIYMSRHHGWLFTRRNKRAADAFVKYSAALIAGVGLVYPLAAALAAIALGVFILGWPGLTMQSRGSVKKAAAYVVRSSQRSGNDDNRSNLERRVSSEAINNRT